MATNIDSFGTLIATLSRLHTISREPERISDYFHSQKVPHVTIYATLSDLNDDVLFNFQLPLINEYVIV